jgi:putative membrane protein
MSKIRDKILIYLKGMLMWACDVIPWVSGWTIAVITWIYERLIQAIKNVLPNLKLFFTWKWKKFRKNINWTFLLCLILWIWTSFVLFANIITNAMENYPILIWSFFVGLILISAVFLWKQVKRDWKTILCLIVFWVLAFFITAPTNIPLSITSTWWWIFICGSIAICAMILPGISGSFMLVLLWMYETMMLAIKNLDIIPILIFWAWAVIWLILFSNVLSWLFKHYKMVTLASLTGFMLGSLNKIWPWKETLDANLWIAKNILPNQYNWDNQLLLAIICFLVWIAIVLLIEFLGGKFSKK